MRKVRSDSILLSQPEGVRRAILRLETEERLTLEQIKERLATPLDQGGFGLRASVTTISEFLRHERTAAFRARLQDKAAMASGLEGTISEEDRARIDQSIFDGLREMILDTVSTGQVDAKDAKALVGLILKSQQQALDARKVAILEQKAADFDAARDIMDNDHLSEEEKAAMVRAKFGL